MRTLFPQRIHVAFDHVYHTLPFQAPHHMPPAAVIHNRQLHHCSPKASGRYAGSEGGRWRRSNRLSIGRACRDLPLHSLLS